MCLLTRSRARRASRGFSLIEVMAALAILSIALVAVMQLFSSSLRTTLRNEDVTVSMLQARALLEEACSPGPAPMDMEGSLDLGGGFEAVRNVEALGAEDGGPELYEIAVTVVRPSGGELRLTCTRAYHEGSG